MEFPAKTSANKRQRKIEKKWTTEEVNLLITMMEERAPLWDYGSQQYRNRDLREANWLEICEATSRSVVDCKAMWNTVKSRYNTERRKESSTKSGQSGERYSSRYEHFKALSFLNRVAERPAGSTQTNMPIELEVLDNPITIEYLSEEDSAEEGVSPKRAKIVDATTPDRTALLNRITNYLDTRSQEPSWKRVFAEHVYCEMGCYLEVDAHRLKKLINTVLDNFEPKDA